MNFHIEKEMRKIMASIEELAAQVAANTNVVASTQQLLGGLVQQIKAAGTDPNRLAELTAQLEANNEALSLAVTQNTPAARSAVDTAAAVESSREPGGSS